MEKLSEMFKHFWEVAIIVSLFGIGFSVIGFLMYAGFRTVTAPRIVTHCYFQSKVDGSRYVPAKTNNTNEPGTCLEEKYTTYQLYGNIEWKGDRSYGRFQTYDEMVKTAEDMNCRIQ